MIEGTGPHGASRVDSFSNWLLLPRYLLDRSVPLTRKLLLLLGVLYIIIPFDITPDFLPVLGWLDDIGIGIFLWNHLRNELANYRQRL
ncbi:MAG: YkvA family protein [Bacillota bacterium]